MVGHFLWELFNWPNGIVVGNLIASALWAVPAFWHLHWKINRHHKWHTEKGDTPSALRQGRVQPQRQVQLGRGDP